MYQCCGNSGVIFAAVACKINLIFNPNYSIKFLTSYVIIINAPNTVAIHLTIIPCNPCAKFSIIKCGIQLPCCASPAAVNSI